MSSALVLGKRKRRATTGQVEPAPAPDAAAAAALEDAQAIFRRHFEAQFAPIQDADAHQSKPPPAEADDDDDDNDNTDGVEDMRSDDSSESDGDDAWGGLSEEGDSQDDDDDENNNSEEEEAEDDSETGTTTTTTVQVVDHSKPLPSSTMPPQLATMTKRELRAYLSSRPPDTTNNDTAGGGQTDKAKQQHRPGENKDDAQNEDSKTLLANDLELQRLINESHILAAANPFHAIGSSRGGGGGDGGGGGKTFAQGRTRALTTDLRLQQLGATTSLLAQRKMPMHVRKGINAARGAQEEKRRREARENGIILEKTTSSASGGGGGGGKKGGSSKKRRGGGLAVDMPGMGSFKNGELKLSKREVNAVEMEGRRMDLGGKRRKRRR